MLAACECWAALQQVCAHCLQAAHYGQLTLIWQRTNLPRTNDLADVGGGSWCYCYENATPQRHVCGLNGNKHLHSAQAFPCLY